MRIVIAGSSGFLGSHLVAHLRDRGHEVVRLVRRATGAADEALWDPYAGEVPPTVIDEADVVVNLAGSPTFGNPHSRRWAEQLRDSRVTTTTVLARAIGVASSPPAFLAGNGISWYGDHGDELLTEAGDSRGNALLTRVTRDWEEATTAAAEASARVCVLRTSPVLDRRSPPLKLQIPLFRAGLGARIGSGEQHFPNISLRDWVGAVGHLAEHDDLSGPFNLCSVETPTNGEFTDALAEAVGRRARLKAPAFVVDKAAGPMSPEVLGSLNTRPQALLDGGYEFQDPDVRAVLASALA